MYLNFEAFKGIEKIEKVEICLVFPTRKLVANKNLPVWTFWDTLMHLHPQIQNPSAFPEEEPSLKVFLFKSINQSKYCFLMGRISNFSILIDFYALTDFYSKVRLCSNKKQSALFSISISNIEFDIKSQTPYWSVLGFWKIEFEKSTSMN